MEAFNELHQSDDGGRRRLFAIARNFLLERRQDLKEKLKPVDGNGFTAAGVKGVSELGQHRQFVLVYEHWHGIVSMVSIDQWLRFSQEWPACTACLR